MKKRLVYLLLFFVAVLLAFVLQKPCFMLYNDAISRGVSFNDYIQVMWHGVSLDATTAGYLTAIPWLTILVAFGSIDSRFVSCLWHITLL